MGGMPSKTVVELTGPDFISSAIAVGARTGAGTIRLLEVFPGDGSPLLPTLKPALIYLRRQLSTDATVVLFVAPLPGWLRDEFSRLCGTKVVYGTGSPVWPPPWHISEPEGTAAPAGNFEQRHEVTNNQSPTAQKAAELTDRYIRS
jgi:hypothetical protein